MQVFPNEWLTTRKPDFLDAELKEDPSHALDFFKGQNLLPCDPRVFVEWHAVGAAEVAPIRNGDSQITHRALETIKGRHGGIIADLGGGGGPLRRRIRDIM